MRGRDTPFTEKLYGYVGDSFWKSRFKSGTRIVLYRTKRLWLAVLEYFADPFACHYQPTPPALTLLKRSADLVGDKAGGS